MPIVTRRYIFQGPPVQAIQNETDPGLTLAAPSFELAFDATFDTAVADVSAVDTAMAARGFVPDPTADTSMPAGLEFIAPDTSRWKLTVDNKGVLSTTKVT